jgi:hypothetical protein
MIKNFALPAFVHDDMDDDLISKVNTHLQHLKYQKSIQCFLKIFNDLPQIKSFKLNYDFESDGEGGTSLYLIVNQIVFKEELSKKTKQSLEDDLHDALNLGCTDQTENFCRTLASQQEMITEKKLKTLIIKEMGQEKFNAWEEQKNALKEKQLLETNVKETKKSSKTKM